MGRVMIAKCAEAQALRKGWQEDLSGVYAPEEMARAEAEDKSAAEQVEEFQQDQRLKEINAATTVPIQWPAGEAIAHVAARPVGQAACRERVERYGWRPVGA